MVGSVTYNFIANLADGSFWYEKFKNSIQKSSLIFIPICVYFVMLAGNVVGIVGVLDDSVCLGCNMPHLMSPLKCPIIPITESLSNGFFLVRVYVLADLDLL